MKALDPLLLENFGRALREFLRGGALLDYLAAEFAEDEAKPVQFKKPGDLDDETVRVRSRDHRLIFVEKFYGSEGALEVFNRNAKATDFGAAGVPLRDVLDSPSLAGLLNDASWYAHYDERYLRSLREREIGYREDEIYLTDRKATVVCAEGFWRNGIGDRPADPLTQYRRDLLLATEYNVSRLAYMASLLSYLQDHPSVRNLEDKTPDQALRVIVGLRAVVARVEESLDLTLLVNHGFSRAFIRRQREEMDFDALIRFVRSLVQDATLTVDLRSAAISAEKSIEAAKENNSIQRKVYVWAIIAAILAVLSVGEPVAQQVLSKTRGGPRMECLIPPGVLGPANSAPVKVTCVEP
ncbi:hypothetical protein [Kineosporia sp. R_H_3]|uniref:hypothetical protein n=1 Tax=Kineosporia sp. R_H_3 TaxID=1961848 RepID=UPI000B4ABC12|nr:hypothetical protein [Kineosporia sp. R_H_3]